MQQLCGISRRDALATLALSPMAAVLASPRKAAATPITFVLVHGAWHGGWCWKKLTPLLRERRHEVFTPTLTGCGERAHLLTRDVGLDTHITDIGALLEYEDLHDVVLVGHSYGGMVIAGVAEQSGARLSQLVYLDALLPGDGESLADYFQGLPQPSADLWSDPPSPDALTNFGVTDARDVAWMTSRLTAFPRKCWHQPVRLSPERTAHLQKNFIQCTKHPLFNEPTQRGRQRGYRSWDLTTAGHDAMVTQPGALAEILLQLT